MIYYQIPHLIRAAGKGQQSEFCTDSEVLAQNLRIVPHHGQMLATFHNSRQAIILTTFFLVQLLQRDFSVEKTKSRDFADFQQGQPSEISLNLLLIARIKALTRKEKRVGNGD